MNIEIFIGLLGSIAIVLSLPKGIPDQIRILLYWGGLAAILGESIYYSARNGSGIGTALIAIAIALVVFGIKKYLNRRQNESS
jgi:hypothetical protein